jgi:hypothetical protein
LDYSRNVVHHYGYNTDLFSLDKDAIKQRFSFINPRMQLTSHYKDSSKINHDIKLSYYNLTDSYKAAENNVRAEGTFKSYLGKELLTVNSNVDFYNNSNLADTSNNTIISLNPNVSSVGNKWKATLGLTAVADINTTNTFHFYPAIDFNYHIIDNIFIPYAGLSGGWTKNSYKSLSDNNPFILSTVTLKSSDEKYRLYGGIRGTLEASTSFNASASYSQISNLPFFVNDTIQPYKNRFDVVYDDVKLLNLHGEIAYQKNEKLRLIMKGDYFKYDTKNELKAWHKPQAEFTFSGNYNLKDKIVAKADIYVIGKQYARIYERNSTGIMETRSKELKGMADINLGLEYRYTKKLSAFINFNNIGAFRYYRWNNYPTQKFNFLVGVSYIF